MTTVFPPNARTLLIMPDGTMNPAWYKFFRDFFDAAGAGTISDVEMEAFVATQRPPPIPQSAPDPSAYITRPPLAPDPRIDLLFQIAARDRPSPDVDALRRRVDALEAIVLAGRANTQ